MRVLRNEETVVDYTKCCVVCGRVRASVLEGRIINGTWYNDRFVPSQFYGKWVCCYNCYRKLVDKGRDENDTVD